MNLYMVLRRKLFRTIQRSNIKQVEVTKWIPKSGIPKTSF